MNEMITNRHGLKLAVRVKEADKPIGLVFVIHGLGGAMDQPHIQAMGEAFAESNYTVVWMDTTNAFGKSEGDLMNVTVTSYIEDLEDVIAWAKTQSWYLEPFVIAGHSLGGISQLVYASRNPNEIKALAPLGCFISGELWKESSTPEFWKEWEETGYRLKESRSIPGKVGKVGFGLAIDAMQYDALELAPKITCPVLLAVGDKDTTTGGKSQELLLNKLGGPKQLKIIHGSPHTPRTEAQFAELKQILKDWIITI